MQRAAEGLAHRAARAVAADDVLRLYRLNLPLMRGIDPRYEKDVSRIPDHIARGQFDVEDGGLVAGSLIMIIYSLWPRTGEERDHVLRRMAGKREHDRVGRWIESIALRSIRREHASV